MERMPSTLPVLLLLLRSTDALLPVVHASPHRAMPARAPLSLSMALADHRTPQLAPLPAKAQRRAKGAQMQEMPFWENGSCARPCDALAPCT